MPCSHLCLDLPWTNAFLEAQLKHLSLWEASRHFKSDPAVFLPDTSLYILLTVSNFTFVAFLFCISCCCFCCQWQFPTSLWGISTAKSVCLFTTESPKPTKCYPIRIKCSFKLPVATFFKSKKKLVKLVLKTFLFNQTYLKCYHLNIWSIEKIINEIS